MAPPVVPVNEGAMVGTLAGLMPVSEVAWVPAAVAPNWVQSDRQPVQSRQPTTRMTASTDRRPDIRDIPRCSLVATNSSPADRR